MNKSTRNGVLLAVAIAALAVAAWRFSRPSGAMIGLPTDLTTAGVCLTCKQDVLIRHGMNDVGPFKCPGCGEDTAFSWLYCNECNHRFVPNLVRNRQGLIRPNPFPYCTRCGCESVQGWVPGDDSQPVSGDAPLPRMP